MSLNRPSTNPLPNQLLASVAKPTIVFGDTDGRPNEIIAELCKKGVLLFASKEDEARAELICLESIHKLKPEEIEERLLEYDAIFKRARLNPSHDILLLGDEVVDRGNNDYFHYDLIKKLLEMGERDGINIRSTDSDHGYQGLRNSGHALPLKKYPLLKTPPTYELIWAKEDKPWEKNQLNQMLGKATSAYVLTDKGNCFYLNRKRNGESVCTKIAMSAEDFDKLKTKYPQTDFAGVALKEFGIKSKEAIRFSDMKAISEQLKFLPTHDFINFKARYLCKEDNEWCVYLKNKDGRLDAIQLSKPIEEKLDEFASRSIDGLAGLPVEEQKEIQESVGQYLAGYGYLLDSDIDDFQQVSDKNYRELLGKLTPSRRDSIEDFKNNAYLDLRQAINFTIQDQPKAIVLGMHAPVGLETIYGLSLAYRLAYDDSSPEKLIESIEKVNKHIAGLTKEKKLDINVRLTEAQVRLITEKYPGLNSPSPEEIDISKPLERLLWNRVRTDEAAANLILPVDKYKDWGYELWLQHGHDYDSRDYLNRSPNVFNYDSNKFGDREQGLGIMSESKEDRDLIPLCDSIRMPRSDEPLKSLMTILGLTKDDYAIMSLKEIEKILLPQLMKVDIQIKINNIVNSSAGKASMLDEKARNWLLIANTFIEKYSGAGKMHIEEKSNPASHHQPSPMTNLKPLPPPQQMGLSSQQNISIGGNLVHTKTVVSPASSVVPSQPPFSSPQTTGVSQLSLPKKEEERSRVSPPALFHVSNNPVTAPIKPPPIAADSTSHARGKTSAKPLLHVGSWQNVSSENGASYCILNKASPVVLKKNIEQLQTLLNNNQSLNKTAVSAVAPIPLPLEKEYTRLSRHQLFQDAHPSSLKQYGLTEHAPASGGVVSQLHLADSVRLSQADGKIDVKEFERLLVVIDQQVKRLIVTIGEDPNKNNFKLSIPIQDSSKLNLYEQAYLFYCQEKSYSYHCKDPLGAVISQPLKPSAEILAFKSGADKLDSARIKGLSDMQENFKNPPVAAVSSGPTHTFGASGASAT